MFLRLLLSLSIAFSPLLEATQFKYIEINEFEKLSLILKESSLHKIENKSDQPSLDLFFCDLDGVLVKDHCDRENAIPINNNSKELFTRIKNDKNMIFGLTARNPKNMEITSENFRKNDINFTNNIFNFTDLSLNYHNGIFYAPDQDEKSTKLETIGKILKFFQEINTKIGRIIFIDNENRHFESNYKETLLSDNKNIDFFFFDYQRKYEPFHGFCHQDAPNVQNLIFMKHIYSEGSGGVYVFKDETTGKKWTIKSWKKAKQGYNECLGAEIYSQIGGYAPGYFMYDDLPSKMKDHLEKNSRVAFYRLAEYIDGGENPSKEYLKENFHSCFVPAGFISSWDIQPANFILKDGKLYLIDFGSAFDSHGFGHDKTAKDEWYPSQFSELSTFFKYKEKYCKNINVEQLKDKIKTFNFDKEKIIKTVEEFCGHGYHGEKVKLISFIEDRYNHLHFLKNLQDNKFNKKADPFQKAEVGDAAGAIPYYTDEKGNTFVLAGKRRGNQLWEIGFGGKSDPEEFLFQTASRELFEESGGTINMGDYILESPCHDTLYAEDKDNILFKRYRSYLVKINKRIDSTNIQDSEHTEFDWIPIAEIKNIFNKEEFVSNQTEIKIQLGEKVLFQPSYEVLCQPQIQEWMNALLKQDKIPATCTQSLFNAPPGLEFIEEDMNTEESDRLRFSYALNLLNWKKLKRKSILEYLILKKDLKEKKNPLIEPVSSEEILKDQKQPNTPAPTASRILLEYLYKKDKISDDKISDENKIKLVMSSLKIDDDQAKFFLKLIEIEEQNSDKEVLYHGLKKELLFCYHVLSVIRSILNSRDTKLTQLRPIDNFFNEFPTIWHLFQYIEKGNNNYSDGFKSAGISVNPSILSNRDRKTSYTARYFLEDDSQKAPNIWAILSMFFQELNLPHEILLNEFKNIYEKNLENQKTGGLIQFFIDPEITNKILYASESGGKTISSIKQNAQEAFDLFRSEKISFSDIEKENIQFRLHGNLDRFKDKIKTLFYYSCEEIDLSKIIEKEIINVTNKYLFSITNNSLYSNVYSSCIPNLIQIIHYKEKISTVDLKRGESFVVKDIKNGNYLNLMNLYLENPDSFSLNYKDKDTLEEINFDFLKEKLADFEKESLNELVNILIKGKIFNSYEEFKRMIDNISFFKDKKEIITNFKDLITERMDHDDIGRIISVIRDLFKESPQNVQKIVINSKNLITKGMHVYNIEEILKTVQIMFKKSPQNTQKINLNSKKFITEENVEEIINLSKNLITKGMDVYNIKEILKIVQIMFKKSPQNTQRIILNSKNFIIETMDMYFVKEILSVVEKLFENRSAENVEDIINLSKNLITTNMSLSDIVEIPETILELLKTSPQNTPEIINISKEKLITKMMDWDQVASILYAVRDLFESGLLKKPQEIIDISKENFITETMSGTGVAKILPVVQNLFEKSPKYAEEIIKISKENLITETMSGTGVAKILSTVKDLFEYRSQNKSLQDIITISRENLITKTMSGGGVAGILDCVSGLFKSSWHGEKTIKVSQEKLITERMDGDDVAKILYTVKNLFEKGPAEEVYKIINISQEKLITETMGGDDVAKILYTVKNLFEKGPAEEVYKIINISQEKLITETMGGDDVVYSLSTVKNLLKNKSQKNVEKIITISKEKLITQKMSKYDIEKILESVENLFKKSPDNAQEIITISQRNLITEKMDVKNVVKILNFVQHLYKKSPKEVEEIIIDFKKLITEKMDDYDVIDILSTIQSLVESSQDAHKIIINSKNLIAKNMSKDEVNKILETVQELYKDKLVKNPEDVINICKENLIIEGIDGYYAANIVKVVQKLFKESPDYAPKIIINSKDLVSAGWGIIQILEAVQKLFKESPDNAQEIINLSKEKLITKTMSAEGVIQILSVVQSLFKKSPKNAEEIIINSKNLITEKMDTHSIAKILKTVQELFEESPDNAQEIINLSKEKLITKTMSAEGVIQILSVVQSLFEKSPKNAEEIIINSKNLVTEKMDTHSIAKILKTVQELFEESQDNAQEIINLSKEKLITKNMSIEGVVNILSVVQSLFEKSPKNAEEIIINSKNLITETSSSYFVVGILSFVENLFQKSPNNAQEIIINHKNLLTEDMSSAEIIEILSVVQNLLEKSSDTAKEIINICRKELINKWMDGHNVAQVLAAVQNLFEESSQNVPETINFFKENLMTDMMNGYDISEILPVVQKLLKEFPQNAKEIISLSKNLITTNMSGFDVGKILSTVQDLFIDSHLDTKEIIELSKNLILKGMSSKVVVKILLVVQDLFREFQNNAQQIIINSRDLITEKMGKDDVEQILSTVQNLLKNESPENVKKIIKISKENLITKKMLGSSVAKILLAVQDLFKKYGDKTQEIIENSEKLKQKNKNIDTLIQILNNL